MKKEIFLDLKNKIKDWKFVEKFQKSFAVTKRTIQSFSASEKLLFRTLTTLFIVSILLLTVGNENIVKYTPENGGDIVEGSIGTPRFINPILATSDTDRDLTNLIYSGLMRIGTDGRPTLNLAESYTVSEDQLLYTFKIKEDAVFHDGQPVTADDVIFTIIKVQDPNIRSPKRAEWEGIVLQKIDERTVSFELKSPYSSFLENMTLGILPKHIWHEIPADSFSLNKYNTEPIGSGPYKISKIKRDKVDIPISYTLKSFKDFVLGRPYIESVIFKFAKNENELIEMYKNGEVESINSISPSTAINLELKNSDILRLPLPRIFGIFLNANESPILTDSSVRRALETAIPKEEIVEDIFFGFADVAEGPIPSHLQAFNSLSESGSEKASLQSRIESAQLILENAGWEKNEDGIYIKEEDGNRMMLSISLSTNNISELVSVAEEVIEIWKAIGINAEIKIFEPGDLNQNVIRPRNFETLLFGMVISKDSDFYAFWHSSQRNDPGLNITNYANIEVDNILEELKGETDVKDKESLFLSLDKEINGDRPAIFLYSPQFIYIVPNKIKGAEIGDIITADDRFNNIHKWYIDTDRILNLWNRD